MAAGFPPGGHARCNARRFPVPGPAGRRVGEAQPPPAVTRAHQR